MCFPERVKPFFMKFLSVCEKEDITEIRMRADSLMSVTYSGKNVVSFGGREIYFDEAELKDIISKLCEESVHTYGKTLKDGFITISGGLRIGVCGHAVVESGKTVSVRDITSVCIRIPHAVYGVCSDVSMLKNETEKQRAETEKNIKLYRTLGIAAGACAAILII